MIIIVFILKIWVEFQRCFLKYIMKQLKKVNEWALFRFCFLLSITKFQDGNLNLRLVKGYMLITAERYIQKEVVVLINWVIYYHFSIVYVQNDFFNSNLNLQHIALNKKIKSNTHLILWRQSKYCPAVNCHHLSNI